MATEYGYRNGESDTWWGYDRASAENVCRLHGFSLIAREVSDTRLLSIRA